MADADREELSTTTADEIPVRRHLSNPSLPDDLRVEEIMVCLPAKAVFRFREACCTWCSRTSTPEFLGIYSDRGPSLPLVAFFTHDKNLHNTLDSFDILSGAEHRRAVLAFSCIQLNASCEGLLLISHTNGRFKICNPATRHCLSVSGLTGAGGAWCSLHPLPMAA
jgi:hypothetical protein